MQVTMPLSQLLSAARLSNKAHAAMCEGALTSKDDLRAVFLAALDYNAQARDALPPVGSVDVFGEEWTKERLTEEANEHYAAHIEIRGLARVMDVDL